MKIKFDYLLASIGILVVFASGIILGQELKTNEISKLYDINFFLKNICPALTTLLAAFLGAGFAFLLQTRKQNQENEREKRFAANKAIFSLFRQFNQLLIIKKQFIDPVRDDPGIFLNMNASLPVNIAHLKINIESIEYLIETEHNQLLFALLIEEEKFKSAISAFNNRSALHLSLQSKLDQSGIHEGATLTDTDLEKILGHKSFIELKNSTSDVVELVDSTIESMETVGCDFNRAMKKLFPNHKFLTFEKPMEHH